MYEELKGQRVEGLLPGVEGRGVVGNVGILEPRTSGLRASRRFSGCGLVAPGMRRGSRWTDGKPGAGAQVRSRWGERSGLCIQTEGLGPRVTPASCASLRAFGSSARQKGPFSDTDAVPGASVATSAVLVSWRVPRPGAPESQAAWLSSLPPCPGLGEPHVFTH